MDTINAQEQFQEQGSLQRMPVEMVEIGELPLRREGARPGEPLDETGIFSGILIFIYASVLLAWIVSALGVKNILKSARTKLTAPTDLVQIPCKSCRYFSKNFYLQCAVRPSDVLTSQAIGCSDYCSQSKSLEK
ncbi:hypothetical protein [Egbenema bharatensis]|uniref:hypothetical protein n=1 Tax=Egbenema bharatensis TaxID=3463334 RepID=UPI003A871F21